MEFLFLIIFLIVLPSVISYKLSKKKNKLLKYLSPFISIIIAFILYQIATIYFSNATEENLIAMLTLFFIISLGLGGLISFVACIIFSFFGSLNFKKSYKIKKK